MLTPIEEVQLERAQQDQKWGEQNHSDTLWLAILGEEFGEVARAILQQDGDASGNVRDELIQVAAVAVAWVESRDRRAIYDDPSMGGGYAIPQHGSR